MIPGYGQWYPLKYHFLGYILPSSVSYGDTLIIFDEFLIQFLAYYLKKLYKDFFSSGPVYRGTYLHMIPTYV